VAKNERIAQITAWPIYVMYIIFVPIVFVLHKMSKGLHKLFGIEGDNQKVTEEEIRVMAQIGLEHGEIDDAEHEMIENIFRFDDIMVKEVMMPFADIVALSATVPVEQIAYQVSQIGHSRYPVYEGDNDDKMIGYIHVNTIMKVLNSDERHKPIGEFVSEVQYVQEDEKIEKVFQKMNKKYSHMFLVQNKKKELIGLVTLEDILEELVGEIIDETDKK
jgi:CBS domain containing-hemolysin-like protein